MLRNSSSRYGWIAIILHWLMAVAIIGMFALGVWMRTLDYYDAWYHRAPEIHKSVGMLLLFTLAFRFAWRLTNPRPELIGRWWEKMIALAVHRMHYLLMFTVMISGYLIPTAEGAGIEVFSWFTVPATFTFDKRQADVIGWIHQMSAWLLIGLAAVHTAAALKHHFVDHDVTLVRMFGITHQGGKT